VEAAPEQRADSEMTPSKDKNGEASSMIPVSDEVLFARFKANPPGSSSLIAQSQARLSFTLPLDYVQFLHRMNGGEGFLGEHAYVALWRVEELRERNAGYEVAEFAPGLFLFGSHGGGARRLRSILAQVNFELLPSPLSGWTTWPTRSL
jgi:hypothetical protein